jgi:hypothetical protein
MAINIGFSVLFDISTPTPTIKVTNQSTVNGGTNIANCIWWLTVQSPSGTYLHIGSAATPDKTGTWATWMMSELWPEPFGTIEWSGANYIVTLFAEDTTAAATIYSLAHGAQIQRPRQLKTSDILPKSNFGSGKMSYSLKCSSAQLYAEDQTKYLYEGSNGTFISGVWTLIYPPDETGSALPPQVIDSLAYVYFDISYNGPNYQIFHDVVHSYDLGDNCTILIKYKTYERFSILCNVDMSAIICAYNELINRYQRGQCNDISPVDMEKKLVLINAKINVCLIGLQQPGTGIDVPKIIEEIKKLGCFDCNCYTNGINGSAAGSIVIGTQTCGDVTATVTQTGSNYILNIKDYTYTFGVCPDQTSPPTGTTTAFSFQETTDNSTCTKSICLAIDVAQLGSDLSDYITYDATNCLTVNGHDYTAVMDTIASIICGAQNLFKEFYVNSNNTVNGNGSISNPFKTIDLAYAAIIGNGTINAPQNPNVTVLVAAGQYTTAQNIYTPGIVWNFNDNAMVVYTGAGTYFVDGSVVGAGVAEFQITGAMQYSTATGGFINNVGGSHNGFPNKSISVTCFSALGTTAATTTIPFININQTDVNSFAPIDIEINLTGSSSSLSSYFQHTVTKNGGSLKINLNGGQMTVGYPQAGGTLSNINLINYNNTSSSSGAYANTAYVKVQDGIVYGAWVTDLITMAGTFNDFILENLTTANVGNVITKPNTFINISTIVPAIGSPTHNNYTFLLKSCYLNVDNFNAGATNVVLYSGTGSTMSYLEMQSCVFPAPLTVDPKIILGGTTTTGVPIATINVLSGLLRATQIPVYDNNAAAVAAGLVTGDIYQLGTSSPPASTGQLMIVI